MQKLSLCFLASLCLSVFCYAEDLIPAIPTTDFIVDETPQVSQHQGIVAVVDAEVITGTELDKRYKTIVASSSAAAELSVQNAHALRTQVLGALINEKVLAQETRRLGIIVSKEDLQSRIHQIEQSQKLAKGEFLKRMKEEGIEADSVLEEIKGILVWEKFLSEFIVPKIEITDAALYEFIDQNHSDKVKVDAQLVSTSSKDSREKITKLWNKSKSCAELIASKTDLENSGLSERSIKGTLQKINDKSIRHAIAYTRSNAKSYIFNKGESSNFILVCDKKYDVSDAELDKIRHELKLKRVEAQAQRYMENLKKKKHIEIHDVD